MTRGMGTHVLVNIYGCKRDQLERVAVVDKLLNEVVREAELEKVSQTFYQFDPVGVTGVIVLAESHISIHTWPEKQSAAVDIFCCAGREKAEKAYKLLVKRLNPEKVDKQVIER